MSTGEGKKRFAAYAKANNIMGAESDDSTPRHARFKKAARLPNPEDIASGSSVREKGSSHPPEKHRRRSRDRRRSDSLILKERGEGVEALEPERSRSASLRRQDLPLEPQGEGSVVGRPKTPVFERRRDSGYGAHRVDPEEIIPDEEEGKGSDDSTNTDEQEVEIIQDEGKGRFHPSYSGGGGPPPGLFKKIAERPKPSELVAEPPKESGEEEKQETPFLKRAVPPTYPVTPSNVREVQEPRPRGGATAHAAEEAEAKALRDFDARAVAIYVELDEKGVEMEITGILMGVPQEEWMASFASLTRPKRAGTGMRYVRLLENFLEWTRKSGPEGVPVEKDILQREVVWKYLHTMTQEGRGKRTPTSFLHALQYFGDAFGCDSNAVKCKRCRKLADVHAKADKPRSQAPMFNVKTMDFLEQSVTNPMLGKGYRIAAGKLRLCIQASLRWDDLQRTPFMNVEWVRRTGENCIIGLRSKFGDSKTGPRPWVASYLGVSEDGHDWLPVLVHLLMESHGEGWKLHDHIGKSYSPEGDIAKTTVASFDQDVQFIRCMLSSAVEEGMDLGMTLSQTKTSRWHGAKSTLTSVMMHRQVGDRAVRFAGNWKECRESMPDARHLSPGEPATCFGCPGEGIALPPKWRGSGQSRRSSFGFWPNHRSWR